MVQVLKKGLQQKHVHIVAVRDKSALRKTHHLVKWSIVRACQHCQGTGKIIPEKCATCHGAGTCNEKEENQSDNS